MSWITLRNKYYRYYAEIRLRLQPYWIPNKEYLIDDIIKEKGLEADGIEVIGEQEQAIEHQVSDDLVPSHDDLQQQSVIYPTSYVVRGELSDPQEWSSYKGITIVNYPEPMKQPWTFGQLPPPQHTWYYHDHERHELFSHFIPKTGYLFKDRDTTRRNRLKPLIYPKINAMYDRTHLIPFGYHGSEADPRLLIGWSSEHNRGKMNDFETRQKKRLQPFFWYVSVLKTEYGAILTYLTIDVKTLRILDAEEYRMKCDFVWNI